MVELLIASGADINATMEFTVGRRHPIGAPYPIPGYRFTPLHLAVYYGHTAIAQLLITHGADVNAKDNDGSTLLHWAAGQGQTAVAQLLITHGADVNTKDKRGNTPLDIAEDRFGNKDMVVLLIARGAKKRSPHEKAILAMADPFYNTVANGDSKKVAQLLAQGADVNGKNHRGNTPLEAAISHGTDMSERMGIHDMSMAKLLLAHGADVNVKFGNGDTPLHLAAVLKHRLSMELLLAHGADVNAKGRYGWTPLHMVASGNHDVPITKLLLSRGADINAQDEEGKTPLYYAVAQDWLAGVQLLLAEGADANIRNAKGNTPLQLISRPGSRYTSHQRDIYELLKKHGAEE